MNSTLYELVYISSAVRNLDDIELNQLLTLARNNNHSLAISGMLLYADGIFLQVLEGEQQQVLQLYKDIGADQRHTNLLMIHEGLIPKRNFPDWTMGFHKLETDDFERVEGFSELLKTGSSTNEAFRVHPNRAHRLLMSFSECPSVVPSI